MKITKKAYNQAVQRMEELLKLTTGIEDGNNAYIKELKEVSDKVYFYEVDAHSWRTRRIL